MDRLRALAAWLRLERLGTRGRLTLYGAVGAVLFLVFLAATFPYSDAVSNVLAPLGLRMTCQDQHAAVPLGAQLRDVVVSSASGQPGARTVLESSLVRLTPALGALILGRPGFRIHAQMYDGEVDATVYRAGDLIRLDFDASGLNLERYPMPRGLGTRLDGDISGSGTASLNASDPLHNSADLKLSARSLSFTLAVGMPPIEVGELRGSLKLDHGVLVIEHLESHGKDFALTASGTVALADDLGQSQANIKFTLAPTESGRQRLGFLLSLLPHQPDSRPYALTGPIVMPSIS